MAPLATEGEMYCQPVAAKDHSGAHLRGMPEQPADPVASKAKLARATARLHANGATWSTRRQPAALPATSRAGIPGSGHTGPMIDIQPSNPTLLRRRGLAVLLSLGLLLGAAACGSSGGSDDAAGSGGSETGAEDGTPSSTDDAGGGDAASACGGEIYSATVCATVKVTGSTTVDDTAASPVGGAPTSGGLPDCATWAEGADDELALPLFVDGLSDGTAFGMQSLITDYTGPGSYDLEQLSGSGSSFTIVVGDVRYQPDPDGQSTATMTVEADGSGSLEAGNFLVDNGSGSWSDPIDADITWTCTDA